MNEFELILKTQIFIEHWSGARFLNLRISSPKMTFVQILTSKNLQARGESKYIKIFILFLTLNGNFEKLLGVLRGDDYGDQLHEIKVNWAREATPPGRSQLKSPRCVAQ